MLNKPKHSLSMAAGNAKTLLLSVIPVRGVIRKIALMVTVLCLVNCASIPSDFEHCAVAHDGQWTLLSMDAIETREMDSMLRNLGSEFQIDGAYKEAWFGNGNGGMLLCRFQNIRDTCLSRAISMKFNRSNDKWVPGTVMVKVCLSESIR